ncbi:unnamed protein product [Closterium sp. Naga37s-1]|nr:unnamed protein product [Closterium sp. Naga37s-1]
MLFAAAIQPALLKAAVMCPTTVVMAYADDITIVGDPAEAIRGVEVIIEGLKKSYLASLHAANTLLRHTAMAADNPLHQPADPQRGATAAPEKPPAPQRKERAPPATDEVAQQTAEQERRAAEMDTDPSRVPLPRSQTPYPPLEEPTAGAYGSPEQQQMQRGHEEEERPIGEEEAPAHMAQLEEGTHALERRGAAASGAGSGTARTFGACTCGGAGGGAGATETATWPGPSVVADTTGCDAMTPAGAAATIGASRTGASGGAGSAAAVSAAEFTGIGGATAGAESAGGSRAAYASHDTRPGTRGARHPAAKGAGFGAGGTGGFITALPEADTGGDFPLAVDAAAAGFGDGHNSPAITIARREEIRSRTSGRGES